MPFDPTPHLEKLRAFRSIGDLHASALWKEIGADIERVLDSVEVVNAQNARPLGASFRAVAWNIQRGRRFEAVRDALQHDEVLGRADVILLSEVDNGLGRSGNIHVARELADALGMGFAFGVSYLSLTDEFGENATGVANARGLAGSAILSRAPILRAINAGLPALRDKFRSSEKRLGRKRAVIAEIATQNGPIAVAQAHLDSYASSAQRAQQLRALIDEAEQLGDATRQLLVGGDLNTTTYQFRTRVGLVRDIMHKLFVTGFRQTVDNYLTPDKQYELPVFELLRARGLAVDGFNERGVGTLVYDFNDPPVLAKVRAAVGGAAARWLMRRLRPWNGIIPAHVDWFAGRGLTPTHAQVRQIRGASDHYPIVVDLTR